MISKHFLKSVILFTLMIILGLVGIFLVSHFDIKAKLESQNTADLDSK